MIKCSFENMQCECIASLRIANKFDIMKVFDWLIGHAKWFLCFDSTHILGKILIVACYVWADKHS